MSERPERMDIMESKVGGASRKEEEVRAHLAPPRCCSRRHDGHRVRKLRRPLLQYRHSVVPSVTIVCAWVPVSISVPMSDFVLFSLPRVLLVVEAANFERVGQGR
jgi:hypothetical protein